VPPPGHVSTALPAKKRFLFCRASLGTCFGRPFREGVHFIGFRHIIKPLMKRTIQAGSGKEVSVFSSSLFHKEAYLIVIKHKARNQGKTSRIIKIVKILLYGFYSPILAQSGSWKIRQSKPISPFFTGHADAPHPVFSISLVIQAWNIYW